MSSSDWSVSGSASQTASADSYVQPPAKTERARKSALLGLVEQVVRPLDRGAQRLLARIGVAAGLEEVEPLREALEQLLRREDDRARSGELEGQGQVVEARAELHDRRVLRPGVERARASHEELDAVVVRERRDRVHVLALQLEPLAARDEDRRARDVAQARDLVGDAGSRCSALSRSSSARIPSRRSATPSTSSRAGCSSTGASARERGRAGAGRGGPPAAPTRRRRGTPRQSRRRPEARAASSRSRRGRSA